VTRTDAADSAFSLQVNGHTFPAELKLDGL